VVGMRKVGVDRRNALHEALEGNPGVRDCDNLIHRNSRHACHRVSVTIMGTRERLNCLDRSVKAE
jgi:hypothetical protein